jgi:hypothetical protein
MRTSAAAVHGIVEATLLLSEVPPARTVTAGQQRFGDLMKCTNPDVLNSAKNHWKKRASFGNRVLKVQTIPRNSQARWMHDDT